MTNADVKIATVTIITEIAVFMGKELLIFLIKDTEDCSIHLPICSEYLGIVAIQRSVFSTEIAIFIFERALTAAALSKCLISWTHRR